MSAAVAIGVLVLWATEAHAYLDAGSGSMILQLLLGGVAGIGVLVKIYWRRLAALFGFLHPPTGEETDAGDERS